MRRSLLIVFAAALALCTARPGWAARDLCKMLKEKGLLTELEYNECKAAEEKKDAEGEGKAREVLGAKLPKWLDYITPFGDLRTRYEGFFENGRVAQNRFRLRGRIGLNANVTDEIGATFRLATGNPDNPVTRNQTFERTFTGKSISVDQAYLTLKPGKSFNLPPGLVTVTAGRFSTNAYRVSELVWDDDLTPEGATESVSLFESKEGLLRGVKLNAFQWVVDELAAQEDPWMGGGQAVTETGFGSAANLTLAFADYHYENLNQVASKFLSAFAKGKNPGDPFVPNTSQNTQLANSNSVRFSAPDANGNKRVIGYRPAFNIIDVASELNFGNPVGLDVPGGLFGELAYNTQADTKNVGFYVGVGIGNAGKDWYHDPLKNKGDWAASYTCAWVERDATLSIFSYDDIAYIQPKSQQTGGTNVLAHIVRFDYEILPNLQLTSKTHFINALDDSVNPTYSLYKLTGNATLVRTQLDAVLKF